MVAYWKHYAKIMASNTDSYLLSPSYYLAAPQVRISRK